ncbi:DNA-binding transcriptional regulator, LysR family [Nonomuraea maritima]|uniref:DNA-binding transcriptional regulator, LysR family n=1 Tax=Nonomuraea maritima TaxID=683260 RepID=A0A1G9EUQ9_9ACTN|nr:LysR family transcriptional regulator [Nonomuraea maritima]SDK79735.1 DNA-binding transcriptional regulator, LysR family [Nonomuraea maritima]
MELRELRAFVAVAEEGGMSAAARRLHISQPALSQTVNTLERRLGVKLLVRRSTGVSTTEAGVALLGEARAMLARHDQLLRTMAAYTGETGGVLRLGVPLELPADLLGPPLERLAVACPETRVQALHLSTAAQQAALQAGELDVGLLRGRPPGPEFDAMLVVREPLGVLLAADHAAELRGPDGICLEALRGLTWVSFPRPSSPAWFDELTAILRSHGLDLGPPAPEGQALIAEVKLAAVNAGQSFALAPPNWSQPLPENVSWSPLVGHPLVRRTWAVWPAASRRRDVAVFVGGFPDPDAV